LPRGPDSVGWKLTTPKINPKVQAGPGLRPSENGTGAPQRNAEMFLIRAEDSSKLRRSVQVR
jgi:hypothetical protein